METVTQPAHSLIGIELTQQQTQLVLIALYALDESLHNPGEPIELVLQSAQKLFDIETLPDTDSDKGIGNVVDKFFKPYFTAILVNEDFYPAALNDEEFGDSAEVISIQQGQTLQVEPS